jgi:hypothetical protein
VRNNRLRAKICAESVCTPFDIGTIGWDAGVPTGAAHGGTPVELPTIPTLQIWFNDQEQAVTSADATGGTMTFTVSGPAPSGGDTVTIFLPAQNGYCAAIALGEVEA